MIDYCTEHTFQVLYLLPYEWVLLRTRLDPCSDKFGLLAGRSGVISDKNAQISNILSGQKWVVSGNFGIKHLWGLSGVLLNKIATCESRL